MQVLLKKLDTNMPSFRYKKKGALIGLFVVFYLILFKLYKLSLFF